MKQLLRSIDGYIHEKIKEKSRNIEDTMGLDVAPCGFLFFRAPVFIEAGASLLGLGSSTNLVTVTLGREDLLTAVGSAQ